MNEFQQIFTVFFAIFWGATASVQGRWKMFNYPLYRLIRPQVRNRLLLSHVLLNICPLVFFAWTMAVLKQYNCTEWTALGIIRIVIRSVLPASAVFGFYRLWVGIIEIHPQSYYRKGDNFSVNGTRISSTVEPTIKSLELHEELAKRSCCINITVALIYIVFGLLGPWCP